MPLELLKPVDLAAVARWDHDPRRQTDVIGDLEMPPEDVLLCFGQGFLVENQTPAEIAIELCGSDESVQRLSVYTLSSEVQIHGEYGHQANVSPFSNFTWQTSMPGESLPRRFRIIAAKESTRANWSAHVAKPIDGVLSYQHRYVDGHADIIAKTPHWNLPRETLAVWSGLTYGRERRSHVLAWWVKRPVLGNFIVYGTGPWLPGRIYDNEADADRTMRREILRGFPEVCRVGPVEKSKWMGPDVEIRRNIWAFDFVPTDLSDWNGQQVNEDAIPGHAM